MCLEAVRENGYNIQYIKPKNQTEKICLEAIRQNPQALEFVEKQTEELCVEAAKRDSTDIRYVEGKYYENVANYIDYLRRKKGLSPI